MKTRAAGGHIRSPQRQLWVSISEWSEAPEERHKTTYHELCRPPSRARALFGLGDPQLGLWATDMGIGCADCHWGSVNLTFDGVPSPADAQLKLTPTESDKLERSATRNQCGCQAAVIMHSRSAGAVVRPADDRTKPWRRSTHGNVRVRCVYDR